MFDVNKPNVSCMHAYCSGRNVAFSGGICPQCGLVVD